MTLENPPAHVVQKIWDPADRRVWRGMYEVQNKKISDWVAPLSQDAFALRKKHFFYLLLPLVFGGILFFPPLKPLLTVLWESYLWIGVSLVVFTLLWSPFLLLVEQGYLWRRRVVFYLLAQERGWEYFYQHIHIHWENLNANFPDLFFKGDQNKRMEDQLWGNFLMEDMKIDFWVGSFLYDDVSGKRGEIAKTSSSQCLNVALHLPSWQKHEIFWDKKGLFIDKEWVDIHTKTQEPFFKALEDFRQASNANIFVSKQVFMAQYPEKVLWEHPFTNVFQQGKVDKRDVSELEVLLGSFKPIILSPMA